VVADALDLSGIASGNGDGALRGKKSTEEAMA
jgi:hypothetical protein